MNVIEAALIDVNVEYCCRRIIEPRLGKQTEACQVGKKYVGLAKSPVRNNGALRQHARLDHTKNRTLIVLSRLSPLCLKYELVYAEAIRWGE